MSHLLSHGRVGHTIREMGRFEGFSSDLSPSEILRGLEYRRSLEIEDRRDLAETLMRLVVTATEGGDFSDVCAHLTPPEVRQRRTEAQQEADAMNTSTTALDFFRGFTAKWDAEHGD